MFVAVGVIYAVMYLLAQSDLEAAAGRGASHSMTIVDLLNEYSSLFVLAFVVTLLVTPIVQWAAGKVGVVDRPDFARKGHASPVPSLGGLAVLLGLLAAIGVSYAVLWNVPSGFVEVPLAVIIGMVAITFTGLADDIWGWNPRLKIAGQLVAAAALAIENVGVKVASGLLVPVFGAENLLFHIPTPWGALSFDVVYWVGTGLIAVFVLGGCNAANLVDGLDGLLSGTVAIVAVGLLVISLFMAVRVPHEVLSSESGSLGGARLVLCSALLGASLGFLPYNFKPASIFLGDCGSHLLGYMCVVIILMFGELGHTHLVFAGLIVFSVPIIDTALALIRRKLAGRPLLMADNEHLHHQLLRTLGGVRRAVVAMYAMTFMFATLGVALAALVMLTDVRVRVIYAVAIVLFGSVGVVAVKAARRPRRAVSGSPLRNDASVPAHPAATTPLGEQAASKSKSPLVGASGARTTAERS